MAQKKVVVAFGTRYGSTRIIAGEVADFLKQKGCLIELVDLRSRGVRSRLEDFDMAVVGSSIAMFSWIAKVKAFLRRCGKTGIPTAVFISSGMAVDAPEKAKMKFLDKIVAQNQIRPIAAEAFAPVIDFRPGSDVPEKTKKRIKGTIKAVAKDRFQEDGLMDLRDKGQFENFLGQLAASI